MTFTTTYKAPVFDTDTYNKVLSRIGRLKKSLSGKQFGSENYNKLRESLLRAEQHAKKIVNTYISDLAIHCAVTETEPTLVLMHQKNIIPENALIVTILREHWNWFQEKTVKAQGVYKPGDDVWQKQQ